MKHATLLGMAGVLLSSAATAHPASANGPPQARIAFANHGAIDNWQADGDRALYVQGPGRQWYHAQLMGSCIDLNFANAIGFDTGGGTGDFDRFSTVIVRGHRCPLTSLVKSGPPPKKAKKTARSS